MCPGGTSVILQGNRPMWFKSAVNSKYEHNNNSFQSWPN